LFVRDSRGRLNAYRIGQVKKPMSHDIHKAGFDCLPAKKLSKSGAITATRCCFAVFHRNSTRPKISRAQRQK